VAVIISKLEPEPEPEIKNFYQPRGTPSLELPSMRLKPREDPIFSNDIDYHLHWY